MLKFIVLFIFTSLIQTQPIFRLSNIIQNKFGLNDVLFSTLGYFKLNLISNQCQISVTNFYQGKYQSPKLYHPQSTNYRNCTYLIIDQVTGSLITNQNDVYMTVGGPCYQTTFSIDDTGIIRLICINNQNEQLTRQTVIRYFYQQQKFMSILSVKQINQQSVLNPVTNYGGWQINASKSIFTMIYVKDSNRNVTYNYSSFNITPSRIYDNFNNTFPYTIIPNVTLNPKCSGTSDLKLKAPYIFHLDPFWPIFRVLDNSGYPSMNCLGLGIQSNNQKSCENFVCPPETYQLNGKCLTQCPLPYFHKIKNNIKRCVLNCQEGAIFNIAQRICTCGPFVPVLCPNNTIPYVGGCKCNNKNYYDGYGCVTICNDGYFGMQGVCVSCPRNCLVCIYSNQSTISLLACSICQPLYILNYMGICQQICNPYLAQTYINQNICHHCSDNNCINCFFDENFCSTCNSLTILWSGICITQDTALSQNPSKSVQCPKTDKLVYSSSASFQCVTPSTSSLLCQNFTSNSYLYNGFLKCMRCLFGFIYQDTCVSDCGSVNSQLIGDPLTKICKCKQNGRILLYNNCLKITGCPIKMYLNSTQNACLSCQYGCVVCQQNGNTKVCLSCAPGFLLYLTSAPYCLQSSFLSNCNGGLQIYGNTCVPSTITSIYKKCLLSIDYCLICHLNSKDICSICNNGYILFQNKCILSCPSKTSPYNTVCIVNDPQDQHCVRNSIQNYYEYALINQKIIQNNTAYNYFILNGSVSRNNPIGFLVDSIVKGANSTNFLTSFSDATYMCLFCEKGFGLTNTSQCKQCPTPCLTCIYSSVNWCTSCIYGFQILFGRVCKQTKFFCKYKQFRDFLNQCVDSCQFFQLPQKVGNYDVNCSSSCNKGTYPILDPETKNLICVPIVSPYTKMYSASYKKSSGYIHIYFFPDIPFKNITVFNKIQFWYLANDKRRNLQQNNSIIHISIDHSYILIINTYDPSISAYVINITNVLTQSITIKGTYFPNSIYGVNPSKTRTDQIKGGLFYISGFFCVVLLVTQIIYTGNQLLYKVDNILVFLQTIYFFAYAKQLLPIQISQFYYGFGLSHGLFLPNIFQKYIPYRYIEYAPLSFMLISQDANIIRNAGSTFTILGIFIIIILLVLGILFTLKYKKGSQKIQNEKLVKMISCGLWQFFLMNMIFFSIAQINYGDLNKKLNYKNFYYISKILSIGIIVMVGLYSVVRFNYNRIGGIYSIKKLLLASILGIWYNNSTKQLLLILTEICFFLGRVLIEEPYSNYEHIILYGQQILIIVGYIICIYSNNNYVVVIGLSIIILLMLWVLIIDLIDMLLERINFRKFASIQQIKTNLYTQRVLKNHDN